MGISHFSRAAQQADDVAHAGVHGTGLHHHAQKAAHHQDEDAHVHRVVKARKSCLQNVAHSLGILLHRVVRPRHRHAVHVVIAARRDDPGGGSHQDQQQEQDRIGCGHVEFFLIQDIYPASVLTPRRQHHFHHGLPAARVSANILPSYQVCKRSEYMQIAVNALTKKAAPFP